MAYLKQNQKRSPAFGVGVNRFGFFIGILWWEKSGRLTLTHESQVVYLNSEDEKICRTTLLHPVSVSFQHSKINVSLTSGGLVEREREP